MDKKQIKLQADNAFDQIIAYIDEINEDNLIEVDEANGIIELSKDDVKAIINFHAPTGQIWFASNSAGAYHLDYDEKKDKWVSNSGQELFIILSKEFTSN